jgi:hypothetical protein
MASWALRAVTARSGRTNEGFDFAVLVSPVWLALC